MISPSAFGETALATRLDEFPGRLRNVVSDEADRLAAVLRARLGSNSVARDRLTFSVQSTPEGGVLVITPPSAGGRRAGDRTLRAIPVNGSAHVVRTMLPEIRAGFESALRRALVR